ncbi:myc-associated zinc finger protein-like [Clytia hemisphaerica]|uniref:myc-associated zinc finger protein-like n=1 Tax=Clytia hemisphaerica TaxID=252671 RepID=UPI0034D4117D|eukprot:TCONS_00059913-protein
MAEDMVDIELTIGVSSNEIEVINIEKKALDEPNSSQEKNKTKEPDLTIEPNSLEEPEVIEVDSDYEFKNKRKKHDAVKSKRVQVEQKAQQKRNKSKTCETCGKVHRTKYHLNRHILTNHTREEDLPFKCSLCGKGKATKDRLDTHIQQVHQNTSNHQCSKCGKYFPTKIRLTAHTKKDQCAMIED